MSPFAASRVAYPHLYSRAFCVFVLSALNASSATGPTVQIEDQNDIAAGSKSDSASPQMTETASAGVSPKTFHDVEQQLVFWVRCAFGFVEFLGWSMHCT